MILGLIRTISSEQMEDRNPHIIKNANSDLVLTTYELEKPVPVLFTQFLFIKNHHYYLDYF